jgi:uncharacterized protein (DUF58 family)
LEFDDLRPYQYGDDVRSINWNVSAKGIATYINTFKEDKDQTVLILFDVSGSTQVADSQKSKRIRELASLIYLCSVQQGSSTAFMAFSNQVELMIKPTKSRQHIIPNVLRILKVNAKSTKTDISKALNTANRVLNKRSLVFVISDFIDENFDQKTKVLAKKHELIFVRVKPISDSDKSPLGIIPARHSENGSLSFMVKTFWMNFGFDSHQFEAREKAFETLTKQLGIDCLDIDTQEDYVNKLQLFFKSRLRK